MARIQKNMSGYGQRVSASRAAVQANRRPNMDIPAGNLGKTRKFTAPRAQREDEARRQEQHRQFVGSLPAGKKGIYNPTTGRTRAVRSGASVPAGYLMIGKDGRLSQPRTRTQTGGTAVRIGGANGMLGGTTRSSKTRY